MLFKPKWVRHHHKLLRLYEVCSAELIKQNGESAPPVDTLSLVIEKREQVGLFESVDQAKRIKEEFEAVKWREPLHDYMLEIRPDADASEVKLILDHREEASIEKENYHYYLYCYYVSTTIRKEKHGISPGHYLFNTFLDDAPKDKSLAAVWTRAKLIAASRKAAAGEYN